MCARRLIPLFLAVFLLSIAAHAARANGASYASHGANVYPVKNTQVRMARELVEITEIPDKGSGQFHFHCTFWFENPADSTSVQMGFPIEAYSTLPDSFVARIDGAAVKAVAHVPLPEEGYALKKPRKEQARQVWLWPVAFRARATRIVETEYDMAVETFDMSLYGTGINYILKTGAFWNGPIGKSEIVVRFARPMPLIALQISPANRIRYERDTLHWYFYDLTPTENIRVHWSDALRDAYAGRFLEPWVGFRPDYPWDHEAYSIDLGEYGENLESCGTDSLDADDGRELETMRMHAANVRHEILARGGCMFRDRALAEYFGHLDWYRPDPAFREENLGAIERLNVAYCRAIEALPIRGLTCVDLLRRLKGIGDRFW